MSSLVSVSKTLKMGQDEHVGEYKVGFCNCHDVLYRDVSAIEVSRGYEISYAIKQSNPTLYSTVLNIIKLTSFPVKGFINLSNVVKLKTRP